MPSTPKPVERLFPFVLRARLLLVGREVLRRSRSRLHFILITTDLTDNSRAEILNDFSDYPVVQHFTSDDLERFFKVRGAKVIGFQKSGLAQSVYAEMKAFRINKPGGQETPPAPAKAVKPPPPAKPASPPPPPPQPVKPDTESSAAPAAARRPLRLLRRGRFRR
jgi:hypothetical protein